MQFNMNKKKYIIHAIGIFITITALQAFTIDIELTRETGLSWYWEFAKAIMARDFIVKAIVALVTSTVIVRYMSGKKANSVSPNLAKKKNTPKGSRKN